MRDYKNVKVPRSHRGSANRAVTRRIEAGRTGRKRGGAGAGPLGSVLAALATAALCYGAWEGYTWLTRAEAFQIAGVDVRGASSASEEDVREIAALFAGQNIFRIDPAAAVRRALGNPWIKDVRIERRLPNRISMVLVERSPRAVLRAANGRFLMDETGMVIAADGTEGGGAVRGLPSIAITGWRAVPGEPVTAGALPEALALLDELARRGGWDPGGVTVKADSAESLAAVYGDHEFRIGRGNYGEKLRRLGEIVSDMNRQGIAYTYVELRPERQAAVMAAKSVKARR